MLQTLANLANLNLVFASDIDSNILANRISLELQNDSLQDTFNSILKSLHLKGIRRSRTILVSNELFISNQVTTRIIGINHQANVDIITDFLIIQGAQITSSNGNHENRQGTNTQSCPLPLENLNIAVDNRINTITLRGEFHKVELATTFIEMLTPPDSSEQD